MHLKPKILVVNEDSRELLQLERWLEELGAEPYCISSSYDAARWINQDKYDGIFLSYRASEMKAVELAERIRDSESNGTCPVVMVTPMGDTVAQEEGLRAGINFFLESPFERERLREFWQAIRGVSLEERQDYERVPVEKAKILCRWPGNKRRGRIVNMSTKGLLMALGKAPPVKQKIKVEFSLSGCPEGFDLFAKVIRVKEGAESDQQVAIRFLQPVDNLRDYWVDRMGQAAGD